MCEFRIYSQVFNITSAVVRSHEDRRSRRGRILRQQVHKNSSKGHYKCNYGESIFGRITVPEYSSML